MPDKQAWDNLTSIFRFKTYATVPDFNTDHPGAPAPAYNPKVRIKRWLDPNPTVTGEDSEGQPQTGYRCYDGGLGFRQITMSVETAKSVNLPPTGTGATNVPTTGTEVLIPCHPLGPNQQLMLRQLGITGVRNLDVPIDTEPAGAFRESDRAALAELGAGVKAIKAKLGVI